MKNKLLIIDVPVKCQLCCEDCDYNDGEKCEGPTVKGTVLTIDDYLKKYPERPREVQEIFVIVKPLAKKEMDKEKI